VTGRRAGEVALILDRLLEALAPSGGARAAPPAPALPAGSPAPLPATAPEGARATTGASRQPAEVPSPQLSLSPPRDTDSPGRCRGLSAPVLRTPCCKHPLRSCAHARRHPAPADPAPPSTASMEWSPPSPLLPGMAAGASPLLLRAHSQGGARRPTGPLRPPGSKLPVPCGDIGVAAGTLWLSGLPPRFSEAALAAECAQFGCVERAIVLPGSAAGDGYVAFADITCARRRVRAAPHRAAPQVHPLNRQILAQRGRAVL